MIEQLFSGLTAAMSGSYSTALLAAFGWGILSILLSPCHLSSIPLIIGYISSQNEVNGKKSFTLSFVFAFGILITIALVGVITAALGRMIGDVGVWGNYAVAVIFFIVGLYLMDIIPLNWAGIQMQRFAKSGWQGALLLGLVFGIGLGPCTFAYMAPVLGIVFKIGSSQLFFAALLVLAFGLGHITVIVIAGSLTHLVQRYLNWTEESKASMYLRRSMGFMVLLGGGYFIYTTF